MVRDRVFLRRRHRRWVLRHRRAPRPLWRHSGSSRGTTRLLCGAGRYRAERCPAEHGFGTTRTLLAYAHRIETRLAHAEMVVADVVGFLGDQRVRPVRLALDAGGP